MDFRKKFALVNLGIFMAVFTVFRLILFVSFGDFFNELPTWQIFQAFADGLRFDLSIILTFIGFPLFFIFVPVLGRKWIKTFAVIATIEFIIMVLILASDIIFFDEVKRHLGDEILLTMKDFNFIISLAVKSYWYLLILIITAFTFYFRFLFKYINKNYVKKKITYWKEALTAVLVILLVISGIRGTFSKKPINVINAFAEGTSQYGNLVLNGVFSSYHVSRKSQSYNHQFYPEKDALAMATGLIVEADEQVYDPNYPLERHRTSYYKDSTGVAGDFNVVIFLLESWTPKYIDSYGGKNFGVTPNFDSLAAGGLVFKNFYANGDRSIYGITASLLGVPQPIALPYLGTGLELYNIFRIGRLFNKMGYRTISGQTSHRGSFRMDVIMENLGFSDYFGMQDVGKTFPYETNETPIFGWDYEPMMLLENKISAQDKPFFAFLFTGTTHHSYILPAKRFEKYPHQQNGLNGYLNTLYYSDWSIGEFFRKARTKKWFDKTIFVFVADHVSRFVANDAESHFKIPLLIYCPALFGHKEIPTLGSQVDIPATIFDLAGIWQSYSGVGKSLMRDYKERFVIFRRGNYMGIITPDGYLNHDLKNKLEFRQYTKGDSTAAIALLERKLLSIDQTLFTLFKKNKFYKE